MRRHKYADDYERIARNVTVLDDGCWQWTGLLNSAGYGRLTAHGRGYKAHRFAYEVHVGPIPDGLTLDHLCRVRACVNLAHLEPVTLAVNTSRSPFTVPSRNRRKTHCPRGHAYDEANTYISRRGSRICRQCRNSGTNAYHAAHADLRRARYAAKKAA